MAKKPRRKRNKTPQRPGPRPRAQGPEQQPLTTVIVPVLDQLEYTKLCVTSLLEHTPSDRFELIVVDNGSGPDTIDYLQTLSRETTAGRVKVIRFDENRGIAPAWNAGVRAARGSYLAFVDNDVLFSGGWLDGLLQGFGREDVWAVVPNMSHMFVPRDFGARAADMMSQPLMTTPDSLVGTFFVVPKRVIDRLGLFDDQFGVGPYADLDFEFRLRTRDKKTLRVDNVCVHHFEGRTVTGIDGFFEKHEDRNRNYFQQKWRLPAPLPPMRADFEFGLWMKKTRTVPPPNPERIARRTAIAPTPESRPTTRIIACVNVFNDLAVLPECLKSIESVDKVCIVDGAYALFDHDKPYSTDGTLDYVRELAERDPRIELIECEEPWKDEATKRSAYFVGRDGDWYLQIDADERLITPEYVYGAVDALRAHLQSCLLDVHFLPILDPQTRTRMLLPRLFRHRNGIRYDAAHWNVVVGERMLAPDWSAPLPIAGASVMHARAERPGARLAVQDNYYSRMYAHETAEFERRAKEIESGLTGDPATDAERLELLWTYYTNAVYHKEFQQVEW